MPRYIALLRAINVGGHVVKMEPLRAIFEGLGLARVETFIASGNVIFETRARDADALQKKIEAQLRRTLGYEVAAFLRTPAELAEIARYEPFPGAPGAGASLYVVFLGRAPSPDAARTLLSFNTDAEAFAVRNREVYWLLKHKLSESTFSGARFEKTLGLQGTMRNVTTVRKLAMKYPA